VARAISILEARSPAFSFSVTLGLQDTVSMSFSREVVMVRLLSVIIATFVTFQNAHAGVLYGVSTATDSIYTIDSNTGQATFVTSVTGRNLAFAGATFLNGELYISNAFGSGSTEKFGRVDLNSGAFTPLNSQAGDNNWWTIEAVSSRIYAYDNDSAGTVGDFAFRYTEGPAWDVTTVNPDTNLSVTGIDGMAYDAANDILYGSGQNGNLYTINRDTGNVSLVGSLGLAVNSGGLKGLAYDAESATLYMTARTTVTPGNANGPSSLYWVNTTTGQATLIGATGVDTIDGLAWAPTAAVPEPGSITLLGLALLTITGYVRRRGANPVELALGQVK
jgi:hypothetical protein